jgi:endo-1,4-beta-xylanase
MNRFGGTKAALASALLAVVMACGGGGSGSGDPVTPTATPTPTLAPGTVPTGASLRTLANAIAANQSRDFVFGCAVDPGKFSETLYTATLAREFTAVVPENCMKFGSIEPTQNNFDFAQSDQLIQYAKDHNMILRGHTLVWHSAQGVPTWLKSLNSAQADAALKNHIEQVMDHFKGSPIKYWDVVNEALNDNPDITDISSTSNTDINSYLRKGPQTQAADTASFWYGILGSDVIAKAFHYTHDRAVANGDSIKLFYNDYSCEWSGNKADALYDLVKKLKASGVPIDGVGFQMHIDLSWPTVSDFSATIKRFTDLGLEVHITELDVRLSENPTAFELESQKNRYHDVVAACLANPKVTAIMVWGITDKYSWIPGTFTGKGAALPFDNNFNAKPAYYGIQAALGGQ